MAFPPVSENFISWTEFLQLNGNVCDEELALLEKWSVRLPCYTMAISVLAAASLSCGSEHQSRLSFTELSFYHASQRFRYSRLLLGMGLS